MTDRDLMQRAVEALGHLQGLCTDAEDGFVEAVTIWTPDIIDDLNERLAQPEQEPVQTIPSFTQLQQIIKNLEHCLSRDSKQEFLRVWIRDWTEHKLSQNTTPPQRTWVGLTEPERLACYDLNPARFASAIEAKLKEKNT